MSKRHATAETAFPILDLNKRHFVRDKGEVTFVGTWVLVEGEYEPCMCILRRGEEKRSRGLPCMILQRDAWRWSEDIGDWVQAAWTLGQFLRALRLEPENSTIHRLMGWIHDHLGDLCNIPPFLPELGNVVAEVTMRDGSGRRLEHAIRAHV